MGESNFPQKIKTILINIYYGQYYHSEITELVKISRVIVTSHLSRHKKNTTYLCFKNGFSLADLAYDCIGDVFEKSSNGEFKNMNSFFTSLKQNINECSAVEVYLAYKSLLLRISEAQETRLFAQFDPNGFKISRNIKENVAASGLFDLVRSNKELVLKSVTANSKNTLPRISLELIVNDFIALAINNKTTIQLLVSLHKVIELQTNYRSEVLLNDAVELFKQVYGISDKFSPIADDDLENLNYKGKHDELEIEEINAKVLAKIKEKILINYYAKGKVTKEQANAMYESLCELVYDWTNLGGNTESFFEYYKAHIETNKKEYQVHIKDKFEYLVKEVKKELATLIYSSN